MVGRFRRPAVEAMKEQLAQLGADIGVVSQQSRYAGYSPKLLSVRRHAAPDNHDGRAPAPGHAADGLAGLAARGARDGAGVDHGNVGLLTAACGTKTDGLESLADLLRLVLVDFTAERRKQILPSHTLGL